MPIREMEAETLLKLIQGIRREEPRIECEDCESESDACDRGRERLHMRIQLGRSVFVSPRVGSWGKLQIYGSHNVRVLMRKLLQSNDGAKTGHRSRQLG